MVTEQCPDCPDVAHDGRACGCGCAGSVVLRRLIAEVRDERAAAVGYNRTYNRHMGGGGYNRVYSRHNR